MHIPKKRTLYNL